MPEWDADPSWEDALETFSGAPGGSRLVSKIMGTSEADVVAPGWQVNTLYDDPTAQAAQDEIAMQRAIASGQMMDPATQRMQGQLALAGNQAYGAAMAAPLKNAATRGRFARGGQRAVSQYAPETLAAQGLMGQEQAQQALLGTLGGRQALMQQELERSKDAGVGQKMLFEEALAAKRAAASGGIASAVGTFFGMFSDEKLKENIAPAGRETRKFIDSLAPKSFNYKGADPRQQQLGVLANDTSPEVVSNLGTEQDPVLGFEQQKVTPALLASVGQLGAENKKLRNALVDLDDKLNAMTGDKDEAVPIVAHGGEVVLPEDVSKKLLKALAGKDKGTLQAFERDILKNKGVLQALERDAPQRDKAKKDENEFTQSYGENVRSAGGYKPKYGGNVPTYEWTSGWEGPPAPEQIVAPRWAIKDIDQRFEIPEKNYPAYADAVIDERRIRYPGMTVGIRGPRSNEEGWMELDAIRREHTAGSPWYRGAPRYPSRYDVPGGKTRTGQSSQMTQREAEEILRAAEYWEGRE